LHAPSVRPISPLLSYRLLAIVAGVVVLAHGLLAEHGTAGTHAPAGMHAPGWVLAVLAVIGRAVYVALCVDTGAALSGLGASLGLRLRATMLAEVVPAAALAAAAVFGGDGHYAPLSLGALLGIHDPAGWMHPALHLVALPQIAYVVVLAVLISSIEGWSLRTVLPVVLASCVAGLLLILVLLSFVML
jgi:hypothetical protein